MTKLLLFSLTFFVPFFPPIYNPFNLSFTSNSIHSHQHKEFCSHHATDNTITFGEEMGKFIKETRNEYKIKTIVLDPGHGGKDPGCSGASSQEKHIALGIAKQLATQLRTNYPDLNVIMTRTSDKFIPLNTRADIANRNDADLFISIHCNYITKYNLTRGTETYVMGLHRAEDNLNVAKRENASILYEENYEKTYDGFDPESDEGHIILSMYQSAFLEQSILFASLLEHRFATAERKSRGVKQAGFLVLRETTMPSVLVETGFLSNRGEEAFLKSRNGQIRIANSIFEAFKLYKNTLEGNDATPMVANMKTPIANNEADNKTNEKSKIDLPTSVRYTPTETRKIETYNDKSQTRKPSTPTYTNNSTKPNTSPNQNTTTRGNYQRSADTYNNTRSKSPIQYRVQIAASPTKINTQEERWQDIPYIVEVIWENNMNKYQIRNLRNFEEADRIRIEMLHKGFLGAFIIAYQDGRRLSEKELGRMK